jgi:hypothetical protein
MPKLRPLGDERREMNPETQRFRLAEGDLQRPMPEIAFAARFVLPGCVEISICSALP